MSQAVDVDGLEAEGNVAGGRGARSAARDSGGAGEAAFDRECGNLVDRDEIVREQSEVFRQLRGRILALPARVGGAAASIAL